MLSHFIQQSQGESWVLPIMAYGYEVLGGVLIFVSSAVTESSMPDKEKRNRWIVFGVLAVVYALFGIGIRHVEIRQSSYDRTDAQVARNKLEEVRSQLETRTGSILQGLEGEYLQLSLLSLDLSNLKKSLMSVLKDSSPKQVADLQNQMHSTQQQADALSHQILALTMAPQLAEQLWAWEGFRNERRQANSNREWEEQLRYQNQHPNDRAGVQAIIDKWQVVSADADAKFVTKLKEIIADADFARKELLQKIPEPGRDRRDKEAEAQFAEALNNPEALNRDTAAKYLKELAQRVPPPK